MKKDILFFVYMLSFIIPTPLYAELQNNLSSEAATVDTADTIDTSEDERLETTEDERLDTFIDLTGSSFADLMNIKVKVTTFTKEPKSVLETPASVYVLSSDEIKRMGVTSVPEALRYVPGLEVARISADKWAISIRGFNSTAANKLLVLIDGRSIYSTLFSGVLWEEKEVLLEDVEQIEIIRGPGGTVWGTNAVNGIVNIVTKNAKDTIGTFVSGGAGVQERLLLQVRYGLEVAPSTYARVYAKKVRRSSFDKSVADDSSATEKIGFRIDHDVSSNSHMSLQGDMYNGGIGDYIGLTSAQSSRNEEFNGGSLNFQWKFSDPKERNHAIQVYYDYTRLSVPIIVDKRDNISFDYQVSETLGRHNVILGIGYKRIIDDTIGTNSLSLVPPNKKDNIYSGLIQDEISLLANKARIYLGTKVERNDYVGWVYQPSIRTSLQVDETVYWGSWTRAVRTPTRLEEDLQTPTLVGNKNLKAEKASTFEIGLRHNFNNNFNVDLTAYHTKYHDVLSVEPNLANNTRGKIIGIEASLNYIVKPGWLLKMNYTHQEIDLNATVTSAAAAYANSVEDNSPRDMLQLISEYSINDSLHLTNFIRYVNKLSSGIGAASYIRFDASLSWQQSKNAKWLLVARSLGGGKHREFTTTTSSKIGPDLALYFSWEV